MRLNRKTSGFSLVELMVVVAVIGTLATIGVADYARFAGRAKYGRARAELFGISTIIQGLRITNDVQSSVLTGSTCSSCGTDILTSWQVLGYTTIPKDPWGTNYHLDENEGDLGPTECRRDALYSGGADMSFAGPPYSGNFDAPPNGDDLAVFIPHFYSHPDCNVPRPDYLYGPDYKF